MPPYPHYDRCRRPRGGAPAAASIPCFPGNRTCPVVPRRSPEAGSPPNIQIFKIFTLRVRTPVYVRFSRAEKRGLPPYGEGLTAWRGACGSGYRHWMPQAYARARSGTPKENFFLICSVLALFRGSSVGFPVPVIVRHRTGHGSMPGGTGRNRCYLRCIFPDPPDRIVRDPPRQDRL